MVQKEVKKKTKIYGAVAVLSAIVLVSMIYTFAAGPLVFPPSQVPSVTGLKAFYSLQDLKTYLAEQFPIQLFRRRTFRLQVFRFNNANSDANLS